MNFKFFTHNPSLPLPLKKKKKNLQGQKPHKSPMDQGQPIGFLFKYEKHIIFWNILLNILTTTRVVSVVGPA